MINFEKNNVITFSKIYPNTPITGSLCSIWQNIFTIDTGQELCCQTILNLTQKLNSLQFYHSFHSSILSMALSTRLMMMICSKNWFLILKHTSSEEKEAKGSVQRADCMFPTLFWNIYWWTCDSVPRTHNSVENFHYII